ncbi:molybdenum ABC transporter ATP-binding protein [Caldimonas brevitalea]|uniref:Molybdenum ABC transporter ATP-binding protein n=1 Tax=Caldimonas brevitalea TaxID=413882 RepID=A0A0G3BNB1_9BURK|nr:molybdenum ABC transporter ATP-binding protein [Caldimonas brevitalea]AKJ30939.1 molybdenum ABC transporter ATP-binding protein [Caldimonas brevitalea]
MIELAFDKQLGTLGLQVRVCLPARGVTAIYGPSGSGKTSLINAVAGLLRPDSGVIRVQDRLFFDATRGIDVPVERRGIGYVFQDARLFPHLSVAGNLRYGLKRHRDGPAPVGFDSVVAVLGIEPLLQRRPHTLSGGERQRVALGRALLRQPRLLLMDEPLAALDAPRKAELLPYIERLCHEFTLPVLYVSHSVDEIVRLAQQIVIVEGGRSIDSGELTEVMSRPAHARLLGRFESGVVLACVVAQHDDRYQLSTLRFADGELRVPRVDLPPGSPVRARVRSRDVALALAPSPALSIGNQLHGQLVSLADVHGPYLETTVALGTTQVRALITQESRDRLGLQPGREVWVMVKSVAVDAVGGQGSEAGR